jgi:hypothetical protein
MEPIAVLLIQRQRMPRKQLRRSLDLDGYQVTTVSSTEDARIQLRGRHYNLVICTDRNGHDSLIDGSSPLLETPGLELYLPGVGVNADAVLIAPTRDPHHLRSAVRQALSRTSRMSA